jgi:hypothetical protein
MVTKTGKDHLKLGSGAIKCNQRRLCGGAVYFGTFRGTVFNWIVRDKCQSKRKANGRNAKGACSNPIKELVN